jgi:UDP-GlcNAc3NAcA epimerase
LHPRTRRAIEEAGLSALLGEGAFRATGPLSYRETMALAGAARRVFTDSGGLQKEAFYLGVPCTTLREETEWVETVETGWNTLAGAETARILAAVRALARPDARPEVYGDGHAAERVVEALERHAGARS